MYCCTAIVVVIRCITIIEFIFRAKSTRIEVVSISSVVGLRVGALVDVSVLASVGVEYKWDVLAVVPLQEVLPEIWLIIVRKVVRQVILSKLIVIILV